MELIIKNSGEKVVATLNGRLDTAASVKFATDMQPLLDAADKHIVLDCEKLEFISSSGLRLFLTLRKATIAKGGTPVYSSTVLDDMVVVVLVLSPTCV